MSLRVSIRYRPNRPDLFAAFSPPGGAGPTREGPKDVRRAVRAAVSSAERIAAAAERAAEAKERRAAAERDRADAEGRRLAAARARVAEMSAAVECRRAAAVSVREILGGRLDEFMMGPIRKLCEERYGVSDRHFLTLFNDVAEVLFPSEWDEEEADRAEQADLRERKIAAGLVPVTGLDRVSTPVIEAFRDEVVRWEDED